MLNIRVTNLDNITKKESMELKDFIYEPFAKPPADRCLYKL